MTRSQIHSSVAYLSLSLIFVIHLRDDLSAQKGHHMCNLGDFARPVVSPVSFTSRTELPSTIVSSTGTGDDAPLALRRFIFTWQPPNGNATVGSYPRLNLSTIMLIVRKSTIQITVEMKPL